MARLKTLQEMFKRYRKPGDIVFATLFLVFAVFLLSQIYTETAWVRRTKWFAQPRFWPAVSVIGMTVFAILHFYGSIVSPRIPGRWKEVGFWLRSFEYVVYFLIYVSAVPVIGYMPSTILFCVFLSLRTGFRSRSMLIWAVVFAITVSFIFRGLLQVKIPAGAIYEALPDALRNFALLYL